MRLFDPASNPLSEVLHYLRTPPVSFSTQNINISGIVSMSLHSSLALRQNNCLAFTHLKTFGSVTNWHWEVESVQGYQLAFHNSQIILHMKTSRRESQYYYVMPNTEKQWFCFFISLSHCDWAPSSFHMNSCSWSTALNNHFNSFKLGSRNQFEFH
jgi:hypothetical protein